MQDIMAQADECWRRSRECEYLAKAVPDPVARELYEALATNWKQAACESKSQDALLKTLLQMLGYPKDK